jgi:hypothetical protein
VQFHQLPLLLLVIQPFPPLFLYSISLRRVYQGGVNLQVLKEQLRDQTKVVVEGNLIHRLFTNPSSVFATR